MSSLTIDHTHFAFFLSITLTYFLWINTLKIIFASLSQEEDTVKLNSEEAFQGNMEAVLFTDRIKD